MLQTLLFLTVYCAGVFQSLFRHPSLIFCVYQCVYFFNPNNRWWGSSLPDFSYSFPIAVILLFLALKCLLDKKEITNSFANPIIRTLLVFLIVFALVTFNAVFEERHIAQVEYFVKAFIIICSAYTLANTFQKLRWYIEAFIFGAFYLSFYTYQIGRNSGDRVAGIGVLDSVDANFVAASLIPGALFALHFLFVEKSILKRLYYAGACVFVANALVLINSRGAMLGIGLGGIFYLYQIYKSKNIVKYAKSKAIGLVFLAIAGALYVADDSAIERFNSIFVSNSENTEVESGATRMHFWKAAVDMAKDHPTGLGYRGFNAYASFYIPADVNTGRSRSRSVHSSWFEALSEVGYLGLVVLLYLVYLSFRLSSKVKNYFKRINDSNSFLLLVSLQACLIANYVSMTFISRMRGETFLWLLMFVAAFYEIMKRTESKQDV